VLVPGGSLVWLAHADGSEIVRQHRAQALELDFLLAAGGPVEAMHRIVDMLRARRASGEMAAALSACRAAAAEFGRTHPPAAIVREVLDGFSGLVGRASAGSVDTLATALAEAERRLRAHRDRIGSLLDAVLTPERVARLRATLRAPTWTGLGLTEVRVGTARSMIGTLITASKAPG
jgi:hypothetical protein